MADPLRYVIRNPRALAPLFIAAVMVTAAAGLLWSLGDLIAADRLSLIEHLGQVTLARPVQGSDLQSLSARYPGSVLACPVEVEHKLTLGTGRMRGFAVGTADIPGLLAAMGSRVIRGRMPQTGEAVISRALSQASGAGTGDVVPIVGRGAEVVGLIDGPGLTFVVGGASGHPWLLIPRGEGDPTADPAVDLVVDYDEARARVAQETRFLSGLLLAVYAVVLGIMCLIAAAAAATAARPRVPELAILKAIGHPPARMWALVAVPVLTMAVGGYLVGMSLVVVAVLALGTGLRVPVSPVLLAGAARASGLGPLILAVVAAAVSLGALGKADVMAQTERSREIIGIE